MVSQAMRTLDKYEGNLLSASRAVYLVGKALQSVGDAIRQRSRRDEQGDSAMNACKADLEAITGAGILDFTTLQHAQSLVGMVKSAQAKLAEAFNFWSESRLEECAAKVSQILNAMTQGLLQADFLVSSHIVLGLSPALERLNSSQGADMSASQFEVQEAINSILVEKEELVPTIIEACSGLSAFLEKAARPKLDNIGAWGAGQLSLVRKLKVPSSSADLWDNALTGTLDAIELSQHGVQDYATALPAFHEYIQSTKKMQQSSMPVTSLPKPYLSIAISFCQKARRLRTMPRFEIGRRVPGGSEAKLISTMYFILDSAFAKDLHATHCTNKVQEAIAHVINAADLSTCTLADHKRFEDGSVEYSAALPLLIHGDLHAMSAVVSKTCNFHEVASPSFASLPHLEKARQAAVVVQHMMFDNLSVDALQMDGGESLGKSEVQLLISVYSNIATTKFVASHVHRALLSGLAIDDKKETICQGQLGAMVALKRILLQSRDLIMGNSAQALENDNGTTSNRFKLKYSMFFCISWLDGIQAFLNLAIAAYMELIRERLQDLASNLEKMIPRWEKFVSDEIFSHELVEAQVLKNVHRPVLPARHDMLGNILAAAENASQALCHSSFGTHKNCNSTITFASGTHSSVGLYLLVQGGCSAVLVHGHIDKGPALAREVLAVSREPPCPRELPASLKGILARLAEGDRSLLPLPAPASSKKRTRADGQAQPGVKGQPPATAAVKAEAGVAGVLPAVSESEATVRPTATSSNGNDGPTDHFFVDDDLAL